MWVMVKNSKKMIEKNRICDCGLIIPIYSRCWNCGRETGVRARTDIEYKGESVTMNKLSKILNISPSTLSNRLQRGWTIEEMIKTPKTGSNSRKCVGVVEKRLRN